VYFPYDYIYPEQFAYMLELKKGLDAKVRANYMHNTAIQGGKFLRMKLSIMFVVIGPLLTGNAIRNWENSVSAFSYCCIYDCKSS
jgi:hypothetical protein